MAYERINWQNEPSEATALNDVNLNKMDSAIYELDGKATTTDTAITALQNGKVDKVTGQGLSKTNDVQVSSSTNVGTEIATVQIFPSTGGVSGVQIKNGVVVDSALSSSSENPVQNKVVKGALDDKVDKVTGKGLSELSKLTITPDTVDGNFVASIKMYDAEGAQTSVYLRNGVTVDSALSSSSENPVENKAIYDALNNLLPSKTVSGNPISISDASGFNAKALTVEMSPIQDLHGYDNPWAGGAGKNKLKVTATTQTINGVTFTVNSDGTVSLSGTASDTTILDVATFSADGGTAYKLSGCPSGGSTTKYLLSIPAVGYDSGSGYNYTPSTSADVTVRITIYSGQDTQGLVFKPMICLASAPNPDYAHYEPYENICPISGRTEASVTRVGVNQWDEEWEVGDINRTTGNNSYSSTQIRTKNYMPCCGGQNYYVKIGGSSGSSIAIIQYDAYKNFIQSNWKDNGTMITMNENTKYFRFTSNSTYGATYHNDISINYPSTDTEYHAYAGQTHTKEFGQTVYGGSLDFVNGGLTNTKKYIELDENSNWTAGAGTIWFFISDADLPTGTIIDSRLCSNMFKNGYNQDDSIWVIYKQIHIRPNSTIAPSGATAEGLAEFKNWLSTNNYTLQVCVELATPTTISTSAESISLLKGNNVLSTDADNMELKYSVSLDSLL